MSKRKKGSSALSGKEFDRQTREISRAALELVASGSNAAAQRDIERMLSRAGVPPRFQGKEFEGFDDVGDQARSRAREICKRYADGFDTVLQNGVCMVLTGNPGTGKTHLAIAVLKQVMRRGRTGMFVTVSEMLRTIRATYSASSKESEQQVFERFIGVDLLVLDEIGVAIGDEEKRKALIFDVINGRYNAMRPTIIIGNLKPEKMREYLGPRVWDRLQESEAPTISFAWTSYRTAGG